MIQYKELRVHNYADGHLVALKGMTISTPIYCVQKKTPTFVFLLNS